MALSILESIRRLIRQDTVRIGGPVGNLYGAVTSDLNLLQAMPVQSWLVLEAAGSEMPDVERFYQLYGIFGGRMQLLVAQDGTVTVPSPQAGRLQLIRATAQIAQRTTFTLRVAVTQPGGACAVYVNGTLARRGEGVTLIPITLDSGTHDITIISNATTATVTAPTGLELSGESDLPGRPTWVRVTTDYLDTSVGTAQNTLTWLADPKVGGYYVLRRQRVSLRSTAEGTSASDSSVLSFGETGADGSYPVVLQGLHATQLTVGSELLAEFESLGVITQVLPENGGNTSVRLRALPGQAQPTSNVIGSLAYLGTFSPITQVARTTNASTLVYVDSAVTFGQAYEYALVAYGLINPAMRSQRSEVIYVVAGDVQPPGSITFLSGYPEVTRGVVNVRFTTPVDADYQGVRVYYHQRIQNETALDQYADYTVTSVAGRVISINDPELPVNALVGYKVRWNNGVPYDVVSNTAGTITVSADLLPPPSNGVSLTIYRNVQIKTDYGNPNTSDELSFTVSELGRYVFCTFDRARNEQLDFEAAYYDVTTLGGGTGVEPIVAFRQLVSGEQSYFASPFDNPFNYAIVEVWAANSGASEATKFDGVELWYRRKGDDSDRLLSPVPNQARAFPWVVSGSAQGILDQPNFGTVAPYPPAVSGGVLSRYVSLARSEADNWIRVWAENADGLSTDIMTFVVDYDTTPEITSLETSIDNNSNTASFTCVVDDDTRGFRWFVTPADAGEPTAANPAHRGDVSIKNFTVSALIALPLGKTKDLTVIPYAGWNAVSKLTTGEAGEPVTRKLVRTPRSYVSFENKDKDGNRSAVDITASFSMAPVPVVLDSGTCTIAKASKFILTANPAKSWTAASFNSGSSTAWYFARIISSTQTIVRRVVTNTATTLELEGDIPTGTAYSQFTTFQILDGAVWVRKRDLTTPDTSPTGFTPTSGKDTYNRATDFYLDYFATKNGCIQESVRTTQVDFDTEAELASLSVSYDSATRKLTVLVGEPDDDCKYWELYLKRGSNPVAITGTSPLVDTLDQAYLRYVSSDVSPASRTFVQTVEPGYTWYAVAVPYNSFNKAGVRQAANTTTADGQSTFILKSLEFAATAGTTNGTVSFSASNGASGPVNLTAYDNANPTAVVSLNNRALTAGAAGADATGTATVPVGFTVSAVATSNPRTWTITGALAGNVTNPTPVSITRTFFAVVGSNPTGGGASPTLSGLSIYQEEPGFCPGSCLDPMFYPLQIGCAFSDANADRAYYRIEIDLQMAGASILPVAWDINPTSGPQAFSYQFPCLFYNAEGEIVNYRFWIKIVQRDSNTIVAQQYTSYLTTKVLTCDGSYSGGAAS